MELRKDKSYRAMWGVIPLSLLLCLAVRSSSGEKMPKSVELVVGKLVEVSWEGLTKAVVKDPEIASVTLLSSNRIALQGVSAGKTTVYVSAEENKHSIEVTVTAERAIAEEKEEEEKKEEGKKTEEKKEKEEVKAEEEAEGEKEEKEGKPAEGEVRKEGEGEEVGGVSVPEAPVKLPELGGTAPLAKEETPSAISEPDLWISMDSDDKRVLAGGQVNYWISFGNRGKAAATDVNIRVALPTGLSYIEGSATADGVYDAALKEVRWFFARLEPKADEPIKVTFAAKVDSDVSAGTVLGILATIESKEMQVRLASNAVTTEVISPPLLAVFAIPDSFITKFSMGIPLLDISGKEDQRGVERLRGLGIVHGYPDQTYRPTRPITRAESVKMIVLGADLKENLDYARIGYVLGQESNVEVAIYDRAGNKVVTLLNNERQQQGDHYIVWDGKSEQGQYVQPGSYEFRVIATDNKGTKSTLSGMVRSLPVEHRRVKKGMATFKDIKPKDWFSGYIAEAEIRRYVRGYPDRTFKPNRLVTRSEASAIVVRALGMEEEAEKRQEQIVGFADDAQIPSWARGYIAVATSDAPKAEGKRIITYTGNRFLPRYYITRGEAAAMINRFIDRDIKRKLTIAGALAQGVLLSVNGEVVHNEPTQFRKGVKLVPGMTVITVVAR